MNLKLCCSCLFGLESVLAYEVRSIGGENVVVTDGKVTFEGTEETLIKANLWLRTAERVLIELASFRAESFEELFNETEKIRFEQFIGKKDAFPVKGWSLNSKLHSIPDCQKIIKKAAVKSMERAYHLNWFEETGVTHQIQFSILKDQVSIMLDTSGAGLHKRGYRQISNLAPIKETLAAGIADLARVRADSVVCDPFCGSGTFVIECALRALNIAPGLKRRFAAEKWDSIDHNLWNRLRREAFDEVNRTATFQAYAYDVDRDAVNLTVSNARKAGVIGKIKVEQRDIKDFVSPAEGAILLCNPPYGERMLEIKQAEELYQTMGKVLKQYPENKVYIISPHEEFERIYGKKADKRRKLYNGMIKCQLFMYYK